MSQKAFIVSPEASGQRWGVIADHPIPEPSDDELVIKTSAYAVNPTDWKHIEFKEASPGDILGSDASGVVHKVGKNVTAFKVGDVVSNFSHGNYSKKYGCFAEYIVASQSTTIKYDQSLKESLPAGEYRSGAIDSFLGAASVTLGLVTVVLSYAGNMQISESDKDKYILVWGGATATGILAIQVAKKGYGLKVVTTASKKNHEYLKSIGADVVVDYNDSDAIEQIKKATGGKIRYALDTVSEDSTWQSMYDATADSPKVTLDSLLFKNESNFKADGRSGEVVVAPSTLAYVAEGKEFTLFGMSFPVDKEQLARYNKFWTEKIPGLVKEISHAKLRVLEPGFESANTGLNELKAGKASAEKIVFSK